jgi:hypothetical protein
LKTRTTLENGKHAKEAETCRCTTKPSHAKNREKENEERN